MDRIRRGRLQAVLEIGCGAGQLAALLLDQGVTAYVGLDYSESAINIANQTAPRGRFLVGDARCEEIYKQTEHDVIVCTEVLEHIEADLRVVSNFPSGTRCLCSVPNFPYESHVRHFHDAGEVKGRYARFFDDFDVLTLKSPHSPEVRYFLMDGVRNHYQFGAETGSTARSRSCASAP